MGRSKNNNKKTSFEIIRIHPDKEHFDIFDKIGETETFIYDSGRKLAEESQRIK